MKVQMTIIIITHREALIALADDVYHMQNGLLKKSAKNTETVAA